MSHPEIENDTPFAFEALFVADEEGRPVVVPIVKATYDILPDGATELSAEQIPVDFSGQHYGEPGESSYRFEPEGAFTKPATDIALVGHAYAPAARATSVEVLLRVGSMSRNLRVTGDRSWARRFLGASPTEPKTFEKVPLVYERAYGGWDRSHEDPSRHTFHGGNPVGVGYRSKNARFEEGAPLPNIEDPTAFLASYRGKSKPAGFGFTCPHWEPRRFLAGTYDDAWSRTRLPLLPRDFNRRYFNAGSPGLVANGYLRGDEKVSVRGASPEPQISFSLPGVRQPICRVALRGGEDRAVVTNLDTIILDLDARKVILLWRTFSPLRDSPLDVRGLQVAAENAPERRALPANVVSLRSRRAA